MASRGSITKVDVGVYRIRYFQGRQNGKRVYPQETVHGSLTQAKKRLTELLRAKDTGSYVEPSKQTVGDYLEHWLKVAVKPRVKRRTYEDYEMRVRRYIRPALGPSCSRSCRRSPSSSSTATCSSARTARRGGRAGTEMLRRLHGPSRSVRAASATCMRSCTTRYSRP